MTAQDPIESDATVVSNTTHFPACLTSSDRWMTWKATEDQRKVPRAPWDGSVDAFASAMDADNWRSHETAREYVEMLDGFDGLTFSLQDGDGLTLMDYDDVRNPDTGEVLPEVADHIERVGGFAQVSTSGTGIHLIIEGELPEDTRSLVIDLEGHPDAELEIYDGDRFIAMTGDKVERSRPNVRDGQALLDDLIAEYGEDATVVEPGERAEEWDASKSRAEIEDTETTSNIEDIFDAIKHTDYSDIRLRSTLTEGKNASRKSFDPSWETSESGTRLGYEDGGWIYRQGNIGLDALQLVALEERIIHDPRDYPDGQEFWDAVEALRARGAPIPEYDDTASGSDMVAVLPHTPNGGEWNWKSATRAISADGMPGMEEARDRLGEMLEDVWTGSDDVLIDALPSLGKSSGAIRATARTGQPVTVYCARHELYDQNQGWCDDYGLTYYTLPSMPRDCPTASGEYGDDWQDRAMDWYKRGATPKAIHAHAENALGRPLPCQEDGRCPYSAKWDFEPDDYDVLIGHYKHAYKTATHSGRVAVFDEFPEDTYTTPLTGPAFKGAVTGYLQDTDDIPADDYAGLVAKRTDDEMRGAIADHFDGEVETDPESVIYNDDAHANAPLAVYALVHAKDLGNGYEHARLPDGDRAVVAKEDLTISLMHTPDLTYTSTTVALDGTPTKRMWDTILGSYLERRSPLDTAERRHYLVNVLGVNVVQTTDYIKPYSSGTYVTAGGMQRDEAILEGIRDVYGEKPALITTQNAEEKYDRGGLLEHTSDTEHYGNLKGTNRFSSTRLGAVIGSRHYGDRYIKRWGAFENKAIETNGEHGVERSYGEFGDKILRHMREHETLQAVLRFGRDGGGGTVFVHTNTLPEWVPLAGRGTTIKVWSDGMKEVMDAVRRASEWTTSEVAERCSITRRQVLNNLNTLAEIGYVSVETDGTEYVWGDGGLVEAPDAGHVEFEDIEVDALSVEEEREISRNVILTWDFAPVGLETFTTGGTPEYGRATDGGTGGAGSSGMGEPPP